MLLRPPRLSFLARNKRRFSHRQFPSTVRDLVEIDYEKRLSFQEKLWLANFNESYAGSNPDCVSDITGEPITVEERRRVWRELKRYERDMFKSGISNKAAYLNAYKENMQAKMNEMEGCGVFLNQEDTIIEMLDTELMELENLKYRVLTKAWRAA